MWYNFPLLAWSRQPYGSASLNKAGRVLSVCPRTDSTWHQHMATDTQLPTRSFILVLLLPPCSFPMTDMILVFSPLPPPFLFLSLWPSWCSLYLETCLAPLVSSNFSPFLSYQTLPLAEPSKADLIASHACTPWVALLLSHESWPSEFHFHFLRGKPCLVCVPHSPT